jgi:hypothetical protein
MDLPHTWTQRTREQLQERGLPCPIEADHAQGFTGQEFEVKGGQRLEGLRLARSWQQTEEVLQSAARA